jgi:flagella basal body P-ring formation protein FlgA
MKNVLQTRPDLQQKYATLRQSLARIGYISGGSVLDRAKLKPPRTGYQWTRKVGQKTVTVALSADQFQAMQKAVANAKRLRQTVRAMEVLSRQILFATTPDTRRFKPLKPRDLRLI